MPRKTNMVDILITLIVIHNFAQIDSAILSRNKLITSSGTYSGWVPQRAIDGSPRRDGDVCQCCASTNGEFNPWYELDLGKHYILNRIHVEGRVETRYGQHFQNMRVFLHKINEGIDNRIEFSVTDAAYNVNYVLPEPKSTRYITLALFGVSRVFIICELTVYGECADGEFGDYCEHVCHCDGDPCNKSTGVCPSGRCLPGYQGTVCNIECPDGKYAPGCTESCGFCSGTDICNKQDGRCPDRCASGYQGGRCKQQCASGSYGPDCIYECGHCHDGEPCNRVTGHCENGCVAGYETDRFCKSECDPGTYGVGCTEQCGNCKNGHAFCGKVDGFCSAGCIAGYKGDMCKAECGDGTYGENCNSNCGYCLGEAACNKKTGVCVDGCDAGYTGDLCVDECSAGFYGNDCSNECKNCVTNTTCHHIHGACIEGCKAGFKAPLCREECDAGTYGPGCLEKCGRCYGNATCIKKNGTCLGCEQGFYGYDCKLEMKVRKLSDGAVSHSYLTALAISGWVCVCIMVIVGTIIFLRIRTRFRQKSPMTATNLYEIPNNSQLEQEHQYECAVVTPPDPVYTNTDLPRGVGVLDDRETCKPHKTELERC